MKQVFITTADTFSPRWQQAFAGAHIVSLADVVLAPDDLVWLLLSSDNWGDDLRRCLQAGAKVIAMTSTESSAQAKQAIAAGASGYIHYLAVPSLLQQVEQVVSLGGMWVGAELMRQLMLASVPEQTLLISHKLERLTPREQAVAEAVAAGGTNKEVARQLDITERTVKAHLGAAFEKLGVRDRLQLVLELRK
jgi:DNA-binding NarL/FixJ family response regulator